jgi:hypothetical protein
MLELTKDEAKALADCAWIGLEGMEEEDPLILASAESSLKKLEALRDNLDQVGPQRSTVQLERGDRTTPPLTVLMRRICDLYPAHVYDEAEILIDYDQDKIRIEVRRTENDAQVEVVLR